MIHTVLHAVTDSLLVIPWIFAVYILIEFIERKVSFFKNGKFLSGKGAPVFGAVAGVFPQCGFSVMSAKLYEKKLIRTGTLMSVFLATSDEAFVLLLSSGKWLDLLVMLVLKITVAVIVGYTVNFFASKKEKVAVGQANFMHEEICAHCHHDDEEEHDENSVVKNYVLVPLWHTLTTFLFVFGVNLVFSLLVYWVGEDKITEFMRGTSLYQPFIVALVGLIPNCASSVLVTQLYISGGITFGSLFAGLATNAGIGIAILFRNTANVKRNIFVVSGLYLVGALVGVVITLIA